MAKYRIYRFERDMEYGETIESEFFYPNGMTDPNVPYDWDLSEILEYFRGNCWESSIYPIPEKFPQYAWLSAIEEDYLNDCLVEYSIHMGDSITQSSWDRSVRMILNN